MTLKVPIIPPLYGLAIFGLLFLLLAHKEIARAAAHTTSRTWQTVSNSLIALLLVLYGSVLLTRFLNLLQ